MNVERGADSGSIPTPGPAPRSPREPEIDLAAAQSWRDRAAAAAHSKAGRVTWTVLKRMLQAVPVLIGVLTITFVVTRAIGDPVAQIAGPLATEEDVAELREQLGLARPVVEQYFDYLGDLVRGDLGRSLQTQRPIVDELKERVGGTFELIALGTLLATIWGIVLGALAAHLRRAGRLFHGIAVGGLAVPDFVCGLVLVFLFSFTFDLAPAPIGQLELFATPPPDKTGGVALDALIAGEWETFRSALKFLVLPVLTLGLIYGSPVAKMAEGAMLETRRKAFIEYAELTGLSRWRVFRYTLRNSLPSIITLSGILVGYLIGGIVLVEIVFSWGGLGQYAAQTILALDLPAIQAFVLIAGVLTVLIYLALDVSYALIDPRVRGR